MVKFDVKRTSDGGRELKFIVDLKPTFELLDYKNLTIDEPEITVSDEDISGAIEQIRNHHADYREVKRPIQAGDFVRLQYTGTLEDGTKIIDLIPKAPIWAEQKNTWEEAGSRDAPGIPAIIQGIIAMEVDGERAIRMEFANDFELPELRGKKVIYHVKIFEIREKILPQLDATLFEKLKVKDRDELKERLTIDLRNRKLQKLRFEQRESVVQKMIKSATFDIPETAIEYEQMYVIRNFVERQVREGVAAEVIQNYSDKLLEDTRELAQDRARVNFVLEKIAEKEQISCSEQDLSQMIMQEASMLRIAPDQLIAILKENRERAQDLQRRALFGKTLDFVLSSNLKKTSHGAEENFIDGEKDQTFLENEEEIARIKVE
jgi:trigger factor